MLIVIFFIPCFIIFLGVFRICRYYKKSKNYYRVRATVLRNAIEFVNSETAGIQYKYYSPLLQFTDKEGKVQTFVSSEDNPDRQLHEAGSKLKLLVNPSDPSRFIYDDWFDGYVISSIWLAIGLTLLILLIIYFFSGD